MSSSLGSKVPRDNSWQGIVAELSKGAKKSLVMTVSEEHFIGTYQRLCDRKQENN